MWRRPALKRGRGGGCDLALNFTSIPFCRGTLKPEALLRVQNIQSGRRISMTWDRFPFSRLILCSPTGGICICWLLIVPIFPFTLPRTAALVRVNAGVCGVAETRLPPQSFFLLDYHPIAQCPVFVGRGSYLLNLNLRVRTPLAMNKNFIFLQLIGQEDEG